MAAFRRLRVLRALLAGALAAGWLLVGCSGGAPGSGGSDDGGGGGPAAPTRPGSPTVVSLIFPSGLLAVGADGGVATGVTSQGIVRFSREDDAYRATACLYRPLGSSPSVTVANGIAYVAGGTQGLAVFRVSESDRIRSLTAYGAGRSDIRRTLLRGTTLLAADHGAGLRVFGAETTSALSVIAVRPLLGALSLAVGSDPDRAYAGTEGGIVAAYDASSTTYPELGRLELPGGGAVRALAARGTIVYALVEGRGLLILNAAVPARMQVLAELPLDGAAEMVLRDAVLLVRCAPADGTPSVAAVDVADPLAPALLGATTYEGALAFGFSRDEPLVLDRQGFAELETADPANLAISRRFTEPGALERLAVHDGWALAATAGGLLVGDCTTPRSSRAAGQIALPSPAVAVAVGDGFACAATESGSLVTLALSETADPAVASEVSLPGAEALVAATTRLYAARGAGGIDVLDLADPAAPRTVAHWAPAFSADLVAVQGKHLYVADTSAGRLHVAEIGADGSLTEVGGSLGLPAAPTNLHTIAGLLSVSCGTAGIVIAKLTDPTAPTVWGSRAGLETVAGSALLTKTAYAACGDLGVPMVWCGGPDAPETFLTFTCGSGVNAIVADRGSLFLGCDGSLTVAEP